MSASKETAPAPHTEGVRLEILVEIRSLPERDWGGTGGNGRGRERLSQHGDNLGGNGRSGGEGGRVAGRVAGGRMVVILGALKWPEIVGDSSVDSLEMA